MLYALGDPVSFVLLVVSFLVAVTVHGWTQAVVASRSGDRRPAASGRTRLDPRRHVDPFGAVAAAIAGVGWAKPVELPDRRRRGALVDGAAQRRGREPRRRPRLHWPASAWPAARSRASSVRELQTGLGGDLLLRALLLLGVMNVFVGAAVARAAAAARRRAAAVRARPAHRRAGRRRSTSSTSATSASPSLLALLLIPLGGPQALLPVLLDTLAGPVVDRVTGG